MRGVNIGRYQTISPFPGGRGRYAAPGGSDQIEGSGGGVPTPATQTPYGPFTTRPASSITMPSNCLEAISFRRGLDDHVHPTVVRMEHTAAVRGYDHDVCNRVVSDQPDDRVEGVEAPPMLAGIDMPIARSSEVGIHFMHCHGPPGHSVRVERHQLDIGTDWGRRVGIAGCQQDDRRLLSSQFPQE